MMKAMKISMLALVVLLIANTANAACFADYKAKRDKPLRLHYGIIELPDAVCGDAALTRAEIQKRIAKGDWQLLNVLSIFDATEAQNRKESAGQFFLRF